MPFYERVLGFRVIARSETPHPSAVLARDAVQIGLTENGGDPTQDGCAFHVTGLQALFDEFQRNGLGKPETTIDTENHDGAEWKVFFVVAPDGLCYWFGERQPAMIWCTAGRRRLGDDADGLDAGAPTIIAKECAWRQ